MDDQPEGVDPVDAVLGEVAAEVGGTVRREPARGREVRRVVLLDHTDERGEQLEVAALGGGEGDNVLDLLAGCYRRNQGGIGVLLRSPEVAAGLSNWHS